LQAAQGTHDSLIVELREEDVMGEQLQYMNGGSKKKVPEDRRRLGLGKLGWYHIRWGK
jgi:hypothetical protein